ncbi:MAG: UDP-N-acetylmuramate dehydrogenase [Lentisphaerae bacterium]|nr:UDP-N-acetylmuramate dehydrogenase [Lentisphaerota bacterium]
MSDLKKLLLGAVPGLKLRENVPYREITTMGVGSTLPLLAEIVSVDELKTVLQTVKSSSFPFFILGAGSNLIGMDAPYPGVALRLESHAFSTVEFQGVFMHCGGALRLSNAARFAADEGLSGLSELGGIPGTLGGALRMNAGASGQEIGKLVHRVKGVTFDGADWEAKGSDLTFSYRNSSIPQNVIVTGVVLELASGSAESEREKLKVELERRKVREPAVRSAGCTFRNVSALEPAGKLIDEAGLRGFRLGDLEISSVHANFIVNHGQGSEADYMQLLRLIRRTVAEKHGFYLRRETCFVNPDAQRTIDRFIAPLKVNVLCGGDSSEREVSLRSGAAVAAALENCGYNVVLSDLKKCELLPETRECDAVFPILHGGFGEGGELQDLLERNLIKFVGSDSVASALVMDKIATKKMLDRFNLPTARWCIVDKNNRSFPENLTPPFMVKAPKEGSSVGIVKVENPAQWDEALNKVFEHADTLLVEEFVSGVELTVPVVNGEALDAIEIRAPHGFYDYDAKYLYKNGHTEYLCPPRNVAPEVVERARQIAVDFNRFAGGRDMMRVDFIVDAQGVPLVLEGNNLPGFTATSLVPKAAAAAGISFERLTSSMIRAALLRRAENPAGTGAIAEFSTEAQKVQPGLIAANRWIFRFILLLNAAFLVYIGINLTRVEMPGWLLWIAAFLLLMAEPVFGWLRSLEK